MSTRKSNATPIEYLVVSDRNSAVLLSTENRGEALDLLRKIEEAGGTATLFRSVEVQR